MIREQNTPKKLRDGDYILTGGELRDGDYILTEGGAWFEIGIYSIRIHQTDEGVITDIYLNGQELDGSVASAYAFDKDYLI